MKNPAKSPADIEFQRWSTEVKRGAISMAILAVIIKESAYGYEIVKQLEERTSFLRLEQGTVYPLLRRLEKRKLLIATWNYKDPSRPRKYYGLTKEGKRFLKKTVEAWEKLSKEMDNIVQEAKAL
ncbi:MAG: PadR family transcriptional regulator [Candidatus Ranarchaeia archaeon]